MTRYSCYLIGEDHLISECARILIENKYTILGIITRFEPVVDWALNNNVSHFTPEANLTTILNHEFDYLISAVNSKILTKEILGLAKKMNINFHNAPLPKYAGIHAVSWAILNEEKQYGVTWHEMTSQIDGGDILEQSIFPVDENETAYSLSVKCYEEAIKSFERLIVNVKNNALQKNHQNISLRNYYSLQKKPKGAGWIQWRDSAENIQKICRATTLGHYSNNTFLSAKFIINNELFIINSPPLIGKKSINPPGFIIKHNEKLLKIATKTNDLIFLNIHNMNSHNIQKNYGINCKADIFSKVKVDTYDKLSEIYSVNEKFWVREINKFQASSLPFQSLLKEERSKYYKKICSYSIRLENVQYFSKILDCEFESAIIALLIAYIYKISDSENINIKIKSPNLVKNSFFKILFSEYVPFNIKLDENGSFFDLIKLVCNKQKIITEKGLFQHDIFFRYPNISNNFLTQESIAIIINDNKINSASLKESISVVINKKTNTFVWYLNENYQKENPSLYKIIKTFPGQIDTLITSIQKNESNKISYLDIVSTKEKEIILNKFRLRVSDYPKNKTIIEVFEDIAEKNPDKIALTDSRTNLSYNDLNRISNHLANHLLSLGLNLNKHAAVFASNNINTIICIIAILKTGAAYIPISIDFPIAHIKNIIQDSSPLLFLTDKIIDSTLHNICDELKIKLVAYDQYLKVHASKELHNGKTLITADNLAYIIYTSGTTGNPKGVMVNHRAILRLVKNTNYIKISKKDVIAQAASISFDAATFEIWGALLNGCKLVVIPNTTLLNADHFRLILAKEKVSILWLTSSLFNQFASINKNIFRNLKYLLVGGEVLNSEMIFNVIENKDGHPKYIINGYGPTENTTFTTTYSIPKNKGRLQSIPIGKSITNTSVYILDKNLSLSPIGVAGELYTGGDGLAIGYLNQPSLTEKKFLLNPIPGYQKERIFKTGDIVRWLPDGNIDYIGRYDNQIKINGFRIEVEGIQNNLLHHKYIQECFVAVEENNEKIKILVAYVVCKKKLTPKSIQTYLSKKLPVYMIPKIFVFVNRLPLTINGKIDHSKLPKPILNAYRSELILPKTQMQKELTTLWDGLFKTNQIGITDNFFEIGGHSLLLTHLIIKLKEKFAFDLTIQKFLENPTIETLEMLILSKDAYPLEKNDSLMYKDLNRQFITSQSMPTMHSKTFRNILLTGCTGFLGAHILSDLCQASSIEKIYCLVRAQTIKEAKEKIEKNINRYCLKIAMSKIYPILGDLSLKNIGLPADEFDRLSISVDLIIHNGAQVNHILNYDALRATNVNATIELINLATTFKVKPLHFISTLSAACNHLKDNMIKETLIELDLNEIPPKDGYSQTKWVSEILLSKAQKFGLPIKIYRPGWIVGQSKTGIMAAENNHLYLLIKGCIQLGYAPNWRITINLMPVDTVSGFIVNTSLLDKKHQVFNLIHPCFNLSWKNLFNYLKHHRGFQVDLISSSVWLKNYLAKIDLQNAIYPIYSLYVNQDTSEWTKDLSKITQSDCINTKESLSKYNISIQPMSEENLDAHFNYLDKNSFLN